MSLADSSSGFAELGLSEPILRAVAEAGYVQPTPVQALAIPAVLSKRDVVAIADYGKRPNVSSPRVRLRVG